MAEYFSHMLISLVKGNKYLLQYYKKTPLIDSSANAYRPMRVYLIKYVSAIIIIRFCTYVKNFILHPKQSAVLTTFCLFDFITWLGIFFGRSPLLFVFALLYTRVRIMRQMLESNNFEYRILGKYHPQRYIQMYVAIRKGLDDLDGPLKLQLFFFFFVLSSAHYGFASLSVFYVIKNYDHIRNIDAFEFSLFLLEVALSSSPLILSAVLADLVTMERQEILAIVLERRIACKNERDHAEIQKLYQFMKNHPFKYRLWRVVPLNVRSLLAFLSFTVTTFIAALQIQAWYT